MTGRFERQNQQSHSTAHRTIWSRNYWRRSPLFGKVRHCRRCASAVAVEDTDSAAHLPSEVASLAAQAHLRSLAQGRGWWLTALEGHHRASMEAEDGKRVFQEWKMECSSAPATADGADQSCWSLGDCWGVAPSAHACLCAGRETYRLVGAFYQTACKVTIKLLFISLDMITWKYFP